ncbi:MAG: endo-1,4-beta-xylanase, partial [Ruminococcus sp.]|nr:endo-1,4-beta-xylanase [Ruminococcus sp.]
VAVFGDNSFIDYAFEYARQYAPEGCKLYYNDYNEYMTGKMDAVCEMAERIKKAGNIDGIGMQSHLDVRQSLDAAFPSLSMYEGALKRYTSLGLDVQITELDATVQEHSDDKYFDIQAKYYKGLFDLYEKYSDKISAVIFWGITDPKSWRASQNPLIFDKNFMAKPAFKSIVDGKTAADPVRTTIASGSGKTTTTTTTSATTTTTTSDSTTTTTTATTTVSTPENVTTTTTAPSDMPAVKKYGDANDDDGIDMGDVVIVMQALANPNKFGMEGTDEHHITKQGWVNADIKGTSEGVTTDDALAVQEYLLKKRASLDK